MTPHAFFFTKQHEWVHVENKIATEGITEYAQAALGDITFVELPAINRKLTRGDEAAQIESWKAAATVYAAVSGTVVEINTILEDDPALINSDPYGAGWLFKVRIEDSQETSALLTAEQYNHYIEEA